MTILALCLCGACAARAEVPDAEEQLKAELEDLSYFDFDRAHAIVSMRLVILFLFTMRLFVKGLQQGR